jgi:hypothetical protein
MQSPSSIFAIYCSGIYGQELFRCAQDYSLTYTGSSSSYDSEEDPPVVANSELHQYHSPCRSDRSG